MLAQYLVCTTVPLLAAWLAMTVMHVGSVDPWRGGGTGFAWLDTRDAFDHARWRHDRSSLRMALTGRAHCLALPALRQPYGLKGMRRVGEREVPLADIVGSVDAGRHHFDRRFDPTTEAAWARYSAVFAARSAGVDLPPVTLYRARDGYYVLDGPHRVAVAHAFGDRRILADVTVLCD